MVTGIRAPCCMTHINKMDN